MAEYAGLEIRIGGNTTKLNDALKASTKSAAELQRNIRQVTKAMQFDPTDLRNIETRIKLTGDRMESLQSKAKLMATSMKQLGDSTVSLGGTPKTIRQIAAETDNLTLTAKQADKRYADMTNSLADIYDAWNKITREKGVDLARKLGIDPKTARELMDSSTSLIAMRSTIQGINKERREALKSNDGWGVPTITPEQLATLEKLKSINFHNMFKNGLELDDVVKEAQDLGVAISNDAVENVRTLQTEFKKAANEKDIFDKALKFEGIGNDLQRVNSEAESLSQTMRWLDDSLTTTTSFDRFRDMEADLRKVDSALENVEADLKRTEESMKVDPKNIQLAARYMQDLQQKVELSEEKSSILNKELTMLDASGAKDAAKSHQDLAKWIEESAENARVAKKELSDQRAEVSNLEDAIKKTTQHIATAKKDMSLIETTDNAQQYASAVKDLAQANANLANAQKGLEQQKTNLANAKQGYDDARAKVQEYTQSISKLKREQQECLEVLQNPMGNSDAALESAFARYDEIDNEVKELDANLADARKSVQEFSGTITASEDGILASSRAIDDYNDDIAELSRTVERLSKTKEVQILQNPNEDIANEEAALKDLEAELEQAKQKEKERQKAYDSARAESNLAKEAKAYDDIEQQIEEARVKYLEATEAMGKSSNAILNPSTLKSLGMTLSATVTPLIAGVGRSMLDASQDIDTAYRNMRKTVDGTDDQFEALRRSAMNFASTHVTGADQILEIEALGGELGIATKDLEAFAEAISNIDVSSDLDTEEAAEVLGHLSNIMHLTAEDYNGFADALVRLGNNGASTESEIANIAERIGSMGSILGMSTSDVLAWASSIASTGQNAEAAGTAISKTMSFFETAVSAAGGTIDTSFDAINAAVQGGGDELTIFANLVGKTADEFAEAWESDPDAAFEEVKESISEAKDSLQGIADVAHMTADEFAKTWESDPTKAMEAFIKGLNDIEASGGSADAVLQGFGITSVRQKQAIEGLMRTIDGLDNNLKMSEDAWNGISDQWGQAGDAANEASKKAEGFSGQMQIMKNVWHNMLAELGEGAAPWLQRFTGIFSSLSEWFTGMSQGAKETLVAIGGIAFATGPLLTLQSTFLTSIANIKDWAAESVTGLSLVQHAYDTLGDDGVRAITGMSYRMSAAKLIAKELGSALLKSLAAGAVVAGVVAITYTLKALYDQYQDHIAATKGLTTAIRDIGNAASESVEPIDGVTRTLGELTMESGGYESRLADLARTISDSNSQYGSFAGQMDSYADTIRTLGGKSELTKDEAYKLEAALQGVNDACGTTYAIDEYGNIIDAQTGKIQDNTDALLANIDTRKQQAVLDYYADDYAKATEQWAKAKDRVEELKQKQKDLLSDNGKAEWIDNYIEKTGRADLAEQAYQGTVDRTATALQESRTELAKTEGAMTELEGKMGKAQEDLDKANKTLEDAAKAEEEYNKRTETVTSDVTGNMKKLSDAFTELGGDDAGFNAMAEGLEAIHVSAEELNNVDMTSLVSGFDSANGSMAQIIATLEAGGVQMSAWNAALEQAPGAAQNMSTLTAAAFNAMYTMAGGDINATMTLIAGLDSYQVGDKTFYVGDNGSVTDSQGKVYDLKTDINELPDEVKAKVGVDNSDAKKKTKEVDSALDKTGRKNPKPKISASDSASATISNVNRKLNLLNGKTATTYIRTVTTNVQKNQATGGMNSRPVIPKHASGYIATGPTLTNQGWIGEDGVEVVANWATGGAVVPLTNKRYMLPIADAIADGMSKRVGGGGVTYNTYINDAVVNGDAEVQAAVINLLSTLQRKGAMNRG